MRRITIEVDEEGREIEKEFKGLNLLERTITREDLRKAFVQLRRNGFFARMNFWCCMSCACAAIPDEATKYVYFHNQNNERLVSSGECYLGWGADSSDADFDRIGLEIIETLNAHGIDCMWTGNSGRKIMIKNIAASEW